MESLLISQKEIYEKLVKTQTNFSKDSSSRKTSDYIQRRVELIDSLWAEFVTNHNTLVLKLVDKNHEYFLNNFYETVRGSYQALRDTLITFSTPSANIQLEDKATEPCGRMDEMLSQQRTNFRAFIRLIKGIIVENISEKWELEDELRNVQSRWHAIDTLHLQIDNILQGGDVGYEAEYTAAEIEYKSIKRSLNSKLSSANHLHQVIPQLEVPTFTGKYTSWPTFYDLFNETIHSNNSIPKSVKMQHLKGRVKGEAERLIQHLNISADNYDTAWEILLHRYSNPQVLFTKQIDIFLNQPNVTKQTSLELKRIYDTTTECIHAIHNLGVDTNTWDPLLVHLLTKKLDPSTYTDYKEARKSPRELPSLDELMSFLEAKFIALEGISRREQPTASAATRPSTSNFNSKQSSSFNKFGNNQNNSSNQFKQNRAFAAISSNSNKCAICNWKHEIFRCKRFLNLTPENQLQALKNKDICLNCLYKHVDLKCESTKRCKECNAQHNTIIHDAIQLTESVGSGSTLSSMIPNTLQPTKQHSVNHVATQNEEVILPTLLVKVLGKDGTFITLRGLLDQGSQISLVSENVAQLLGLQRKQIHASVSGIGPGSKQGRGIVNLTCQSTFDDFTFDTKALVIAKVINNLPNSSFKKHEWSHLQHINLADPAYNVSRPIDILLDASVYSYIIMGGLIKGPPKAPIAQQTRLGWILSGDVDTSNKYQCNVVIQDLESISKYWELEDISTSNDNLSVEDKYCEDFYTATTKRLDNGCYEVGLPMKPEFEKELGSSRSKAVAQFHQLEQKMSKNSIFSDSYIKFIEEYQSLGHMTRATKDNTLSPTYYLPHHGVLKADSLTTRLRVVFNASSPTSSTKSLNDLMYRGPNLQKDLMSLILHWRKHRYVYTADIEKMFRTIFVRNSDRSLQTIVWRPSSDQHLLDFNLTTVSYGLKASPFLAMRTLQQLAKDESANYPLAASVVQNQFYMDDLLSGHDSIASAKTLQLQLIAMLKSAGMNLRKWSSNHPDLISNLSSEQLDSAFEFRCAESRKTLGLSWIPSHDVFTFKNKLADLEEQKSIRYTKRKILSEVSQIFDPVGWLSPLTIKAKLLFQKTWSKNIGWDDELPIDMITEWRDLKEDFKNIYKFSIPRYLGPSKNNTYILHGFCDSSEKAYACAIYVVTDDGQGNNKSVLVAAKTKLAPISKKVSLPRLELCGALLLAQLTKKVIESLPEVSITVYAWTDSMIVLGWLKGDISRWKQFVSNRIQQITEVIPATHWYHVSSSSNSSDCASRGMNTSQLLQHSLWWKGPEWLTSFNPNSISVINYEPPTEEIKKQLSHVVIDKNNSSFIYQLIYERSSINSIIKTVGWVSRYVAWLKCKQIGDRYLTTLEFNRAYLLVIKHVQAIEFYDEIHSIKTKGFVNKSSKIASLNPFMNEHGILCVGGRLRNSSLPGTAKTPIILSSHSRLTDLIINHAHITTLHGGARLTLSYIRQKFWILSGVRTVKRELRKCVKCRRFTSENIQQRMADLPTPRVTPSRPFTHTGVDFTGHVELKANKGRGIKTVKGYIAVFVCLATKATHMELVSDLSTSGFLAAFQRFRSRRGTPLHVYSDNGRNFCGSDRVLKKEYQQILSTFDANLLGKINEMDIVWHFNAPIWPSAGGLWEAAVKSLKYHLKRVIGDQKLTFEEFSTLIHQIEACLNSRPLYQLTESSDEDYLTPGHFLVGGPLISRPQADPDTLSLTIRWQMVQSMYKHFWKRWSSDYLQQLQIRSKWRKPSNNLEVGNVVLIKDDNLPPGKWPMGKIIETHPGKDGLVRVVSIKTRNSIMKRPVLKLVLLPTQPEDTGEVQGSMQQTAPTTTTGQTTPPSRASSPPKKCNIITYIINILLLLFAIISPLDALSISQSRNVTTLSNEQALYFDKMYNLKIIKDDWNLIVFYNMSMYWQRVSDIKHYVQHVKKKGQATDKKYNNIVAQLEHDLSEIEHYNNVLKFHQLSRKRRGLIDGVGYVANSLFGVLDQRFAERYESDIKNVQINENHLQSLIRNQTIVMEAEASIVKRNERLMNEQFTYINGYLKNITEQATLTNENHVYVTSSALIASIIIANLRRIQNTLIDTITDIGQGHINVHLLTPEQLSHQLEFIASRLQGDLTLPVSGQNIAELYKVMRVAARLQNDLFIIEAKLPLVSSNSMQIDKIITLTQSKGIDTFKITTLYPFIAFDLRMEKAIFLTDLMLQTCFHTSKDNIICSLDEPVYDLKIKQSLCDINLISENRLNQSLCEVNKISPCRDIWVKSHRHNVWIYSCCTECRISIICVNNIMFLETLRHKGILQLANGCNIKGDSFTLFAHNNFYSKTSIYPDIIVPDQSVLNNVMDTSLKFANLRLANNSQDWERIHSLTETIREETQNDLSIHDVHHYAVGYTIISTIVLSVSLYLCCRWRRRSAALTTVNTVTTVPSEEHLRSEVTSATVKDTFSAFKMNRLTSEPSAVRGVNQATSPMVFREVKFDVSKSDGEISD